MNKRLQKKTNKRKKELLHRILDLVLDINGLECRKKNLAGNKPTVFLDFSGHVCKLEVSVIRNGWESGAGRDVDVEEYLDTCSCEDLKVMIRKLEAIKAETPAAGTAGESR